MWEAPPGAGPCPAGGAWPGAAVRVALLLALRPALLLALLVPLGCGLKTPPRPLTKVLPAPQGVHAWQRGETLIVAWRDPDAAALERFGGYAGIVMRIEPQPEVCFTCPLPDPVRHTVTADDPAEARRGGFRYVPLPWPGNAERLLVRTRMRFGAGTGPEGETVFAVRAERIPTPGLHWRWVGAAPGASAPAAGTAPTAPTAGTAGSRAMEFYWERPPGGGVHIVGADGLLREQAPGFGANLYRRVVPGPWPLLPLNAEPLQVQQWTRPPLRVDYPPQATGEEFLLRFVDRFGNEGPPSAIVQIPLPGRRP